tara:strand:+ start:144 stop:434 length:291 start_codon:yes stop_codon:yes gene_type:complete
MEQDETNNNEDLDRLEIAKQKIGGRKEFYEFARILKEWVDESEDCCRKTIDTVMYDLLEEIETQIMHDSKDFGSSQETVTWLYLADIFEMLMLENT